MWKLYSVLLLCAGTVGCSDPPSVKDVTKSVGEVEMRDECIARKLACNVTQYDDDRWLASARKRSANGDSDRWYGNGETEEQAITALMKKLDSSPDWPATKREVFISAEPK